MEYHRSSEVNIAGHNGQILVLGKQEDNEPGYIYDTVNTEIFYLPEAGMEGAHIGLKGENLKK